MSGKQEFPTDPRGWLEYLGDIDYSKHKKSIIALGAVAAFGIGVGTVVVVGGRRLAVRYADQRHEEAGIVSVVEMGEDAKDAAGLPTNKKAFKRATGQFMMFVMNKTGLARPDRGPIEPEHIDTLRAMGEDFQQYLAEQSALDSPGDEAGAASAELR